MYKMCTIPCWPLSTAIGWGFFSGLLVLAGFILSILMLIDCLKRSPAEFPNPITEEGKHDKKIWAAAILLSFWCYFIGTIVYFFVVRTAKPKPKE
jgi:uncharacterized BrkB/YihY/UPF0761 family membrane protein